MGEQQIPNGVELMESLPIHEAAAKRRRRGSLEVAIGEVSIDGDFAEFGVYKGRSATHILELMKGERKLHLFDSFEGLPEDWTKGKAAGTFAISEDEIPTFDDPRTVVHKGWFKDTVPGWAQSTSTPLAFIHMDADLYSSTMEAFVPINHMIKPGTIILFDEYTQGRTDHEHRALYDWAAKFGRKFEHRWRSAGQQVCVRITQ